MAHLGGQQGIADRRELGALSDVSDGHGAHAGRGREAVLASFFRPFKANFRSSLGQV